MSSFLLFLVRAGADQSVATRHSEKVPAVFNISHSRLQGSSFAKAGCGCLETDLLLVV